jgi:hypothetical protein
MAKISNFLSVTFHVESRKLPTVLEVVRGSATLVSVLPMTEEVSAPREASEGSNGQRYHGGKRDKGISGESLVLKVLEQYTGLATFSQFAQAFEEHGFAKNSASPALSIAVAAQKVRALGGGRYCLPGTVIKQGADVR